METETNDKVLAMYQAVWNLIEEGSDIYKLKVSDITARAGIGKGTAYEYFRSKEELLERALHYDACFQLKLLLEDVEKQNTLKESMDSGFAWMEKNIFQKRFVVQFLKISGEIQKQEIAAGEIRMQEGKRTGIEFFHRLMDIMIEKGRREGIIAPDIPRNMAQLELFSKFFAFFVYLKTASPSCDEEVGDVKEFLYKCVVKSLSVQ